MINSLYVHIPFCLKKCLYCDFNSYIDLYLQDEYIKSLVKEIERIDNLSFRTIFVGGGTPTVLSLNNLMALLESLKRFTPDEFTFEANPGTINKEKMLLMKEYGVNRISIGLQAWQDNLLQRLGRIHKLCDFLSSYEIIRNSGFNNINVDLMFAIPEQKMEDWVETVENVLRLNPEHISCYSLIIEEGTPFFDMYKEGKLDVADEDTEREMYYYTVKTLGKYGYNQYEISNFAKTGYECRHNITYWNAEEYIGVGAGAHSYTGCKRYSNYRSIYDYIKGIEMGSTVEEETILSINDEISEFMFMGLRMTQGIEKRKFKERFKTDIYNIYKKEIKDLIKKRLITDNGEFIRLTEKGIDLSNQVFVSFLK